ncbi:fatty acid desaturase family protein [Parachryseolinea silvisoli]|jgi:linoleoyl-CoA desaturase|uniref:fatty acid desaturase family protein n=1 Tax=Parachryseolinea silvisoli TaxID=2873601 RepID=UPI002265E9AC|nr:acyl-CoA desaturase [Parachryseolinea silvisoli]MCD9015781.1 acyl-CoA desaturase [Parachryseolinea silvisoli]
MNHSETGQFAQANNPLPAVKPVTFANTQRDFSTTLNKRVNEYFRENKINRHGDSEMVLKTIFMFTLYCLPYALLVTGVLTGTLWALASIVVMGLGLAGIGLSVMHDANHGAYSNKTWVNTLMGYSLNLVGANAFNWKMQHNVLHHTYTNVHEEDEDISPRGVLRLTPHSSWKHMHRYQFIYAWFLYGLMTIVWLFFKDFVRIVRYGRDGLAKKHNANIAREWFILIVSKLVYVSYIFVIPMVATSFLWWQVLLGVVLMHYIAGFILAIIFQPAHVVEGTEFPLPNDDNMLENNWAVHQLHTTTNFGNSSRWFSWYVGGLNFQIEHHLFPNICHVHYRKISNIVQQTAAEYGLPYKSTRTFMQALRGHARLLRELGKRPVLTPVHVRA